MPAPSESPTASPTEPRAVFLHFLGLISDGRWTEIADLYAEDVDVTIMFTDPPVRLHHREELRKRFDTVAATDAVRMRAENIRVHQTDDPEVVIAEFDYDGLHPATGHTFHAANIQVMRIRDGLIVETRDYHDHRAMAAAREP